MKISEKDLESLFDADQLEFGPEEGWKGFDVDRNGPKQSQGENIKIKKVRKNAEDEFKITRVRKSLKQIRAGSNSPKMRKKNTAVTILLGFVAFAGISGFIMFAALNFPSLYKQIKWSYYSDYLGKRMPAPAPTPKIIDVETPLAVNLPQISPEETKTAVPIYTPVAIAEDFSSNGTLVIGKINVNVPIIWNVEEDKILDELNNGVAHYKGTSLPGNGGNIFIVGHSSNYFWIKSDYNNIFALLNKLIKGDRIEIIENSKTYTYEVQDKKIVSPDQVEVLNSTNKEVLSLMTCWPIGTNINRLVVLSELVNSP